MATSFAEGRTETRNDHMKKFVIGCSIAATAIGFGVGSASAAQPVVQGCVGESVSANAMAPGPYGGFINGIAKHGGIGGDVQQVQAGLIPDDAYWNTCND